jgi:hypothetical protein
MGVTYRLGISVFIKAFSNIGFRRIDWCWIWRISEKYRTIVKLQSRSNLWCILRLGVVERKIKEYGHHRGANSRPEYLIKL